MNSTGETSTIAAKVKNDKVLSTNVIHSSGRPDLKHQASAISGKRRRFTAEEKLRILHEAEACKAPGELTTLLRTNNIHYSHLAIWRRQRDKGAIEGLTPKRRGPNPWGDDIHFLRRRILLLEKENKELNERLKKTEGALTLCQCGGNQESDSSTVT